MKLELKHLDFVNNGKVKLSRLPHWEFKEVNLQDCILDFNPIDKEPFLRYKDVTFGMYQITPYKRPISDLTKEIELLTEDFNLKHTTYPKKISLLDYLNIAKTNPHKYRPRLNIFEYSLGNTTVSYNFDVNGQLLMPYDIVRLFYMNHFDVFGLIEKGLAIDINTLNK